MMRSRWDLLVLLLTHTSLAANVSGAPTKYDPLQALANASSPSSPAGSVLSAQSVGDDVLDLVAHRDLRRWLVKVKSSEGRTCADVIADMCAAASSAQGAFEVEKEGSAPVAHGTCERTKENDEECLFTFVGADESDVDALLSQHEGAVDFAERDMKVVAEQSCAFSFPQSSAPWHLDLIDRTGTTALDSYYSSPEGALGAGAHVYVLDTGLRTSHADFYGRVGAGYNVFPDYPNGVWDDNGHGTAVASVAAGTAHGVCKCCVVHPVKCLDANGDGSYSAVVSGLAWVKANAVRPAVASLSLSGPTSQAINSVIKDLYREGILVFAASGNERVDACTRSPGSSPDAVTVGASWREGGQDRRSEFSNYGACVDIYAPGTGVLAAASTGDYASDTRSGTSFSAPAVAGVAALYLAQYPEASAATLKAKTLEASTAADTIEYGARLLSTRALELCEQGAAAQDCQLGSWSAWGPACPAASSVCGRPRQTRTRVVLNEPTCGGQMCGAVEEERDCEDPEGGSYKPCVSDFPNQWFGSNDPESRQVPDLDIAGRTVLFSPKTAFSLAADGYSACVDDHLGFDPLEDFDGATKVTLADDAYVQVTLGGGETFPFYGLRESAVYVSSNGYATLGAGSFDYMVGGNANVCSGNAGCNEGSVSGNATGSSNVTASQVVVGQNGLEDFIESTGSQFLFKRISALLQDLEPSLDGDHGVYIEHKEPDTMYSRLVITFDRVPLWGLRNEMNTFQIVLYLSSSSRPGDIQMWWGAISGVYRPHVGISPGFLPEGQIETDLIPDLGTCSGGALPPAPVPPAELSYVPPPPPPPPPPPATGGGFFSSF